MNRQIQTGKGTIALMTLLAIWSISLTVNLPGLAITPVLNSLDKIFPHTSELEIQLLTVLPNLCIIPFVLLSGRLSLSKSKVGIVVAALVIYLASGVAYMFAESMVALIVISCMLGVGCGLLIPLAAGLLADTFVGKYRMQQLGIKSGISNLALVVVTFVVGWLNHGNWHLPFLVYLIPAIPLALSPFLRGIPKGDDTPAPSAAKPAASPAPQKGVYRGFYVGRTVGLVAVYFFVCYATIIVSYYLPFLMGDYGMSTAQTGTVTALFFLAVFLPGFVLPYVVRGCRQKTLPLSAAVMAGGIILMILGRDFWVMCLAALLMGAGYGVFQPLIYDKATEVVTDQSRSTLALAIVLAANYVSISATPFIVEGFQALFGQEHSNTFPFVLNFAMLAVFTVLVIAMRRSFVFRIDKSFYE